MSVPQSAARPGAVGPGRLPAVALVTTIALVMGSLVLAGRPTAAGAAVSGWLPEHPTTRLAPDVNSGAAWQVNQGVLPARAAWDELGLLARRHQEPVAAGHWLTVDLLDPNTPAGRFSLDFEVADDAVALRAITVPGRSVSLEPGVPVLSPGMVDGGDASWQGTVALDADDPARATVAVHAEPIADGCLATTVDLDLTTETFTWCPDEGLAGWRTDTVASTTGFEPGTATLEVPGDPVELDETPQAPLAGETALEVGFFRIAAGAYRQQLAPHGSRATWAADQLVIADTEGRVTSWLPIDDTVDGSYYTQLWRTQPGGSVRGMATVGAVTVLGTTQREVIAYDRDGWELWRTPVRDGVTALTAVGELVLVLDASGDLTVLEARTGTQAWQAGGVDQIAAAGEEAAVTVEGTDLVVHQLETGHVAWQVRVDPRTVSAAVVGDRVAIATGNWLVVRDAAGAVAWSRSVPADTRLGAVGGQLLVSELRTARVLDATGAPLWASEEPMPTVLPVPDGVLGVMSDGLVLDGPGTSRLTWRFPDRLARPELTPLRGDRGIVAVHLDAGAYRWLEYR